MKHPNSQILPLIFGLALIAIAFGCSPVHAQTNPPAPTLESLGQQFYDATIGTSNGVFVATAARKLTGNANRYSVDYIYSFNQSAGLVLGIDDIRAGGYSSASILKGGLTLQTKIYPLKNFRVTNLFVTPAAFALVATPMSGTSNNGGIGQLAGTSVTLERTITKNLYLELGGLYENSTGEGKFNGNWAGVIAGLHYKF